MKKNAKNIFVALWFLLICALLAGCDGGGTDVTTAEQTEPAPEVTSEIIPETTEAPVDTTPAPPETSEEPPETTEEPTQTTEETTAEVTEPPAPETAEVTVYGYGGQSAVYKVELGQALAGTALDAAALPEERDGVRFTLLGWEYAVGDGERAVYDPSAPPAVSAEGMCIYQLIEFSYRLRFSAGEGEFPEGVQTEFFLPAGSKVKPNELLSAMPERAADGSCTYSLYGFVLGEVGYFPDADVFVMAPIELVAVYDTHQITYKVVFKTELGTFPDGSKEHIAWYLYGEELTAPVPSAPAVGEVEFTFAGWDSDLPATVTGEAVYTAVFTTPEPYSYLNLYLNGELLSSVPHYVGSALTAPERPAQTEGMIFTGWELPETMPEGDLSLYAEARMPVVTYVLDGEKVSDMPVRAGSLVTVAPPAIKQGYTVSGWSTADIPALNGGTFIMPETDVTFVSESDPNNHTVTYILDGAVLYIDHVVYGELYALRGIEVKRGYEFLRWTAQDPAMNPEIGIFSIPDADIVFIGSFKKLDYNVNYYIEGELVYSDIFSYGDSVTLRPNEVQEGCTFAWTTAGASVRDGVFIMPAADVDIHGVFSDGENCIVFMIDGEKYGEIGVSAGGRVDIPLWPTKVGYSFTGWSSEEIDVSSGEFIMPEGELVLRGSFIPNVHSVIFADISTLTAVAAYEMDYGASFSINERVYCDAGRVSSGIVHLAGEAVFEGNGFRMPDEDVIFGLVWEKCLTLEINEGVYVPYYALLYEEYEGCRFDEASMTVFISDPEIKLAGESEGIRVVRE